jgi:hypothetical protein
MSSPCRAKCRLSQLRAPGLIPQKSTRRSGPTRSATAGLIQREHTLRQRSYSELIFSSLSRLAVMDSSTELVPLIHSQPSRRRV